MKVGDKVKGYMDRWLVILCAGLAGCPGVRPDVRGFATGRMFGQGGRMSGLTRFSFGTFCDGRRIFGTWAGCPVAREGPDVRAMAGCPAAVAADSSSFSFLRSRAHLALVLGLSLVSSGVPEYAQGPLLK